ncbi:cytochrome P450 2A13-like [Hippoglossus stenolepis]|uniref:cytochrome P450 2A13-like n=1 Tax=Hippoglossus stenolepis TaxID=195615 RepID=UPI00159C4A8A|nr:cytochrome P450 2A13-like [Hippoglossus stenolepis]
MTAVHAALVGYLPQLDKNAPFKSCLKFSETYGPVMTLHLGWQRTVVLVGYDAVKEALVDQADDFMGRGPLPFLIKATRGYGLGISNGERWRQLVRFTLSTLRDFGMGRKGMEEWMQEENQHLRGSHRLIQRRHRGETGIEHNLTKTEGNTSVQPCESLARMELFIFVVSLLQRFTFSCADGPDGINLDPEYSSFTSVPRLYQVIAAPR